MDISDASNTLSSPRSFEGIQKGHKSLFDASTKMIDFSKESIIVKDNTNLVSPLRKSSNEERKRTLMKELSGARFKCTNCKNSRIEVELPCVRCKELNCQPDQKQDGRHKKR